jgi:LuxR family quorum-sensing system transcriptional regulator CciR
MADQFDFNGMISGFLLAKDEADLHNHLDRCAHELGFRKFAMGHHVDLSGPPQDAIRVTNYDPAWIERSLGDGYFVYDPVHQASTKTAMGFLWSDIPDMIRLACCRFGGHRDKFIQATPASRSKSIGLR